MDRPLDDATYRDKLEEHIRKIEKATEDELKGQHQSNFNVWFNEKLIKFFCSELELLPPKENSIIK